MAEDGEGTVEELLAAEQAALAQAQLELAQAQRAQVERELALARAGDAEDAGYQAGPEAAPAGQPQGNERIMPATGDGVEIVPSSENGAIRNAISIAVAAASEYRDTTKRTGLTGAFTLGTSPTTAQGYQQAIQTELETLKRHANTVLSFQRYGASADPLPDGSESPSQAAERRAAASARQELKDAGLEDMADIAAFANLSDRRINGIAAEQGRIAGSDIVTRNVNNPGWGAFKAIVGVAVVGGAAYALDQHFNSGNGLSALRGAFSGAAGVLGDIPANGLDGLSSLISENTGMGLGDSAVVSRMLGLAVGCWGISGASGLGRMMGGGVGSFVARIGMAAVVGTALYQGVSNSDITVNPDNAPVMGELTQGVSNLFGFGEGPGVVGFN